MQEGHLVHVLAELRKDTRDPLTTFPVLLEFERGLHQWPDLVAKKPGRLVKSFQRTTIPAGQFRLVIPRVDLAVSAVDEDPDHRGRTGGKMRLTRCQ